MAIDINKVCVDENWMKDAATDIRNELLDLALVVSDILVSMDKPSHHGFKTKARLFRVKSNVLDKMLKQYRSDTLTFEHNNLKD